MTPALRSLRLLLYSYTPSLVTQEHVDWLNNPDLTYYSEQRHHRHSIKTQYDYVRSFRPCDYVWLIRCGAKDIGTITAYIDALNGVANLGILLGPSHQGQGLATEAWLAVIDWLFSEGIRKVEAGCRADNWAMRRLAISTGMFLEGEIPGHFKVGDEAKAMTLYGRFQNEPHKSEWDTMWQEPFWKPMATGGSQWNGETQRTTAATGASSRGLP